MTFGTKREKLQKIEWISSYQCTKFNLAEGGEGEEDEEMTLSQVPPYLLQTGTKALAL